MEKPTQFDGCRYVPGTFSEKSPVQLDRDELDAAAVALGHHGRTAWSPWPVHVGLGFHRAVGLTHSSC